MAVLNVYLERSVEDETEIKSSKVDKMKVKHVLISFAS